MLICFLAATFNYMGLLNNSGRFFLCSCGWVDTLFPKCSAPLHLPYFPNAYANGWRNERMIWFALAPNLSNSALDINNVTFSIVRIPKILHLSIHRTIRSCYIPCSMWAPIQTRFLITMAMALMDSVVVNYSPIILCGWISKRYFTRKHWNELHLHTSGK